MASMLRDERILDFDIIAIQEPWRNEHINIMHHPCSQHLDLLYFDSPETRTCTFISKKISIPLLSSTGRRATKKLYTYTIYTTLQLGGKAQYLY
jgi:hypothetical protein